MSELFVRNTSLTTKIIQHCCTMLNVHLLNGYFESPMVIVILEQKNYNNASWKASPLKCVTGIGRVPMCNPSTGVVCDCPFNYIHKR